MLLNCIRQKSVTSWRSSYSADNNSSILSMPFSEEACERCRQRARENDNKKMASSSIGQKHRIICPLASASMPPQMDSVILRQKRKDPVIPSPPLPPSQQQQQQSLPPPCPFPSSSSSSAALPPKPQSPQPIIVHHQQQQISPIPFYSEPLSPLNSWDESGGGENSQPPRPARNNNNPHQQQRGNLLLKQLRTTGNDGEMVTETRGAGGGPIPIHSTLSPKQICIFLEHQGETKRSMLPPNLRTVEQLKSLFLRSFPGLASGQLQSKSVKMYIQKPGAPRGLFYELEDIRDLEAHSILRLFEQSPPSPAAHPPLLPPRIPTGGVFNGSAGEPIEYLSEPEMLLEWNGRNAGKREALVGRELAQLRPASVLGGERDGPSGNERRQRSAGFTPLMVNDWSGHSSDSSSCSVGAQYPKSGSSTPREDREETRRKVDSLERQLASLCSLVHSALLPSSRRDSTVSAELAQLRAQIVEYEPPSSMHSSQNHIINGGGGGSGTPMVDSTTSTLSNGSAIFCNGGERRGDFGQILSDLGTMKAELGELRREAQKSAFVGNEMIQKAMNVVKRGMRRQEGWKELSSVGHLERLANVQSALRTFEASLENTRSAVLNSTRRLKLDEVDELAARLGEIGRETVELKVEMPILQRQMEEEMRQTMERLASEERALREKCKGNRGEIWIPPIEYLNRFLANEAIANAQNVLYKVTMKKLAIIQDEERPTPPITQQHFHPQRRTIPVRHISLRNCQPLAQSTTNKSDNHPLDAILDELNANAARSGGSNQQQQQGQQPQEISASFTLRLAAAQQPTKAEGIW